MCVLAGSQEYFCSSDVCEVRKAHPLSELECGQPTSHLLNSTSSTASLDLRSLKAPKVVEFSAYVLDPENLVAAEHQHENLQSDSNLIVYIFESASSRHRILALP